MKKLTLFLSACLLVLTTAGALTGCSADNKHAQQHPPSTDPLKVTYTTTPTSPVKVNETVRISVTVTQKDEIVKDASDVKFEIWKSGQDTHNMLEANRDAAKGEYFIEQKFSEAGTYFVMYHVTARDQHSMTKNELIVK